MVNDFWALPLKLEEVLALFLRFLMELSAYLTRTLAHPPLPLPSAVTCREACVLLKCSGCNDGIQEGGAGNNHFECGNLVSFPGGRKRNPGKATIAPRGAYPIPEVGAGATRQRPWPNRPRSNDFLKVIDSSLSSPFPSSFSLAGLDAVIKEWTS